ncbi:MAG: MotA/TolQ/ExbB proton channel family protein [Gammaproteobacteria bacterium]|jgi:biopolymer transport protein ExbB|nr:MotA/TolQ/ExbB proton channel family protein [Gammaproteobacteria bacterium]
MGAAGLRVLPGRPPGPAFFGLFLVAPTPALAQADAGTGMLEQGLSLVRLGGPVVVVLLAMSVVALAVSVFKMLHIGTLTRGSGVADQALDHWVRGDTDAALALLEYTSGEATVLLRDGMQWLGAGKPAPSVREELVRRATRLLADAGNLLGVIEQVAYLAPLLGLLGTVLGIIDVFQGLAAHADASAGTLAGGIWEALLTTAVGLCVAVPFAIVHAALENRIERFRARMEDALTRLFTVTLYRAG